MNNYELVRIDYDTPNCEGYCKYCGVRTNDSDDTICEPCHEEQKADFYED